MSDLSYIAEQLRPLAVPIEELTPDPTNAMDHPDENLETIRASLERFGQRKPIVVRREGMVVSAGNGTLASAKALGWTHIAAVICNDSAEEATAFALIDNRSAQLAQWNEPQLQENLKLVQEWDDGAAKALGWTEMELVAIQEAALPPMTFDAPPQSVQDNQAALEEIKAARKRGAEGVISKTDTERYLVLVYPDRAGREAVLTALGLPTDERYIAADTIELRRGGQLITAGKVGAAPIKKSGATG